MGSLGESEGSALTEFAIVAPIFVLLLFWSQFFADIGVVGVKVEEAARYAVWETTAQRPTAAINDEVRRRFANLASPERITRANPVGVRSFSRVTFTSTVRTDLDARMSDVRIALPPGAGGSALGPILSVAMGLVNRAVGSLFNQFRLSQRGASDAEVTATFQNTIFPTGRILNIFFDAGQASGNITMRSRTPALVVDTWKAWPGIYRNFPGSSQDVSTDVYNTYPNVASNTPSAVEREVAATVSQGAFWGHDGILRSISGILSYIAGPNVMSSETWATRSWRDSGPIAILPAEPPRHGFVPGAGAPVQRIGGHRQAGQTSSGWVTGTAVRHPEISASPGVDRARFTVPGRVNSVMWADRGGTDNNKNPRLMPVPGINSPNQNPYLRSLNCRDVFYMGARNAQSPTWDEIMPREARLARTFQGCF